LIWYADGNSFGGLGSIRHQEPRTGEKEESAEDFNKEYGEQSIFERLEVAESLRIRIDGRLHGIGNLIIIFSRD
jgi:hypothetical protein